MALSFRGPRGPRFSPFLGSRSGFTLLELATAITLLAVALNHFLPAARRQLDRLAVLGAREELVGLFHQARMEAVARGGAVLVLRSRPPGAAVTDGVTVLAASDLSQEYGITLSLSRDREEVELRFDALGLGRVATQTLRLQRGEAEAVLLVSSYGRVSRP